MVSEEAETDTSCDAAILLFISIDFNKILNFNLRIEIKVILERGNPALFAEDTRSLLCFLEGSLPLVH